MNFPGGVPVDGPSAGTAMVTVLYSAITATPIRPDVAMTGEVSIRGLVKPVGGVAANIEAARLAGARLVIIPQENWQEIFSELAAEGCRVLPAERIEEVVEAAVWRDPAGRKSSSLRDLEPPPERAQVSAR